jgi:plastocyanin
MKATLLFLLALLLGFSATAANITITVGDNYYSPQTVTVRPGDVVTWQYQSGSRSTHPTASDNGAWPLFTINGSNPSKSITFSAVGSYPYHCTAHGAAGSGMYGVITVTAPLPTTAAQDAAAFVAYPNPASEAVTLKLDRALVRDAATVQLISQLGGVARTLAVSPASGTELLVSVADLPAGLYVYRLLANGAVVATQRLTILR